GGVSKVHDAFVVGLVVESHPGADREAVGPDCAEIWQTHTFAAGLSAAVVARRLVEEEPLASLPFCTIWSADQRSVVIITAVIVGIAVAKTVVTHQRRVGLGVQVAICQDEQQGKWQQGRFHG
ncbi:MAG: hypothetical protein RL742_1650, partial [Bacteroidota bacterium]